MTTYEALKARLVKVSGEIDGLRRVYPNIPRAVQDADLPGLVIYPGRATYGKAERSEQIMIVTRQWILRVVLLNALQGTEHQAQVVAEPFFDSIPAFFFGRPGLETSLVSDTRVIVGGAALLSDGGLQVISYGDTPYAAIDFTLETTREQRITYFRS